MLTIVWLSALKMDKMVTKRRLAIHLEEAPELFKEWGEGQYAGFQVMDVQ